MSIQRAEPFQLALETLRDRLRRGAFPYERRLAASDIAQDLRLSPTPVREALARLAGEGLVEDRRGQGYFVPLPSAREVTDLFRLSLAQLLIAASGDRRPQAAAAGGLEEPQGTPVERTERLFERWAAGGSRALVLAHRATQARLAPVRRLEPLLIPDLAAEADDLDSDRDPARQAARLRAFHHRRIRMAAKLAALLEAGAEAPNYRGDIV